MDCFVFLVWKKDSAHVLLSVDGAASFITTDDQIQ